jgi:beta-lactamase superfamily II metal-dependent hydrolase
MTLHGAGGGDAIALAWGEGRDRRHALVDLGDLDAYRSLRDHLARLARCDLLVITHADARHAGGAAALMAEAEAGLEPGEIWFNGYHHLATAKTRKPQQHESCPPEQSDVISESIRERGWLERWNLPFGGGPVSLEATAAPVHLAGGLSLTLLSPSDRDLAALEPHWRRAIEAAGLVPGSPGPGRDAAPEQVACGAPDVEALAAEPLVEDPSPADASSIAFIAEHGGKRVLLAGDARPGRLEKALRALGASEGRPLRVDCMKLSHHGAKSATSTALLSLVDCTRFAFSSDGSGAGHPDPQTIARILMHDPVRPKELVFNGRTPSALRWDDPALMQAWRYVATFPTPGFQGVTIAL